MQRAVNPDTGEVLYLVNNQWVPPAQVATNPKTGEIAHLIGNEWQIMPAAKTREDLPAPESDLKANLLAGTKLSPDAPPMGNRMISEVGQAEIPELKNLPKLDASKMPTAEDRAAAQFGVTPEMGTGEKALRTAKGSLYGASTGLQQTWLGGARMISDITGLGKEGVEGASKQLSKEQQAVEKTYAPEYGLRIAKDIGSSVIQNIPTIGVGLYAGSTAALTNMFTQSFMQTYDDSRNEGLGVGASTARSALYGTAEALGESIGLPYLLKGAKDVLKGVPTADLAKDLAKYIVREIPGEQLTYVAQFLTDKGFNLNPEAGMKEFLQGVQDTALVTVGQTAVMGGAGFTTNKILKELRDLHSKGAEGIPKAADMVKQAGFDFQPKAQVAPQEAVQPQVAPAVTPSVAPISGAIRPEDIEPEPAPSPAGKPTFDEWRSQQGLMFGSKEEYQAALPKLQAQYQAEMSGAPAPVQVPAQVEPAKTEAPKFAQDETGQKLTYPMFVDMANKGYQLHSFENPRTYENKGGQKYRTLEKDGVRIALEPKQVLFTDPKKPNQQPQLGIGNENDVAFHFIGVDPELRNQGKARAALQDLVDTADKNNYTLYGEPAQLEKEGMTVAQLTSLYADYGFETTDKTGKVIVREPSVQPTVKIETKPGEQISEEAQAIIDKPYDERSEADDKVLEALRNQIKEKIEDIKAPPFKKGYVSSATIHLAPFNGGWISTGSYMGPTGGYGSYPGPTDNVFKTKQEAINNEIDRMRGYALSYEDPKALVWLSDIDPRMEKITEAEAKRQVNIHRQEVQKKRDAEYDEEQKLAKKWYPILQKDYGWDGIGEYNHEIMLTTEDQFIEDHGEDALEKLYDANLIAVHEPSFTGQLNEVGKKYADTTIVWATDNTVPDAISKSQSYKDKAQAKFEAETAEEEEAPAPKKAAKPTKEEKVATNKARQAEKKAPKKLSDALTGDDLVEGFVPEQYKKNAQKYVDARKAYDKAWQEMEKITDKNKRQQYANEVTGMRGLELDSAGRELPQDLLKFLIKAMETDSLNKQQEIISAYEEESAPKKSTKKAKAEPKDEGIKPRKFNKNTDFTKKGTLRISSPTEEDLAKKISEYLGGTKISIVGEQVYNTKQMLSYYKVRKEGGRYKLYELPEVEDKPTKQEHVEGNKSEPLTSKTIEESIAKAETKVDHKNIKTAIKNQFDQAIKRSTAVTEEQWKKLPKANQKVVIDVPGDGKFTVNNYTENLQKYQKKAMAAAIPKEGGVKRELVTAVSVSAPDVALKNLLEEGEFQAAQEYAKLKKLDVNDMKVTDKIKNDYAAFVSSPEAVVEVPKEEYTPAERKDAEDLAKDVNGEVAWQRGNLALLRGYAILSGQPVYMVAKGDERSRVDVDAYTGKMITSAEKAELIKVRQDLEKHAEALHDSNPFIQFKNAVEASENVPDGLAGVVNGWKQMLKITPKIYITTMEDVDANKNKYTGPHRVIGTATLSSTEAGSVRKMRDGNYYIAFKPSTSKTKMLEILAHEMGHIHEREVYENAAPDMKQRLKEEHKKFLMQMHGKTAQEFVNNLRAKNSARSVSIAKGTQAYDLSDYWKSFSEWYADQVSKWATTQEKPLSVVDKYFKKLANQLRQFYQNLKNKGYLPNEIFKQYMDKVGTQEIIPPGNGEDEQFAPKAMAEKIEPAAKEVEDLIKKHNRPDTPLHPSGTVSDAFMGSVQTAKKVGAYVKENPTLVVPNMIGKADRAMTYMRNKSVWYGTGLDSADFSKYNGQLRDSHGTAVASIAVTNTIHAGHIGTQVMIQGGFEFNPKLQMFIAKKTKNSMANVITLKSELVKKLGAQTANNLINGYFEAKRSRSIINEYLNREAAYEDAIESGEDVETAQKNLKNIEVARQKVNMSDEEMDDFIGMEKKYPELRKMMDNWTAVNHNQIDMAEFAGIMSKKRAQQLKDIEDYVPWYRIMDNQSDVHQPSGGVVRTLTHVGKEKSFKKGATDRDIDDIVDNMIHNVMMMTRNSMRNYAANRVVMEYGTRKENGKLKVFPQEDHANGIFSVLAAGRRINVQIADPLIAEAVIGMENVNIPMFKMMEAFTGTTANILRRTITTNPIFQIKQVFKDAPTAAWVSGMRNPFPIWGDTLASFFAALNPKDPIVLRLKAAGIGGFQSTARSPEKELKIEIGLLNHSAMARALKLLDHIGDASDYAQRRAIYKRVLAKTKTDKDGAFPNGDEMQALIQANNVIDFLKRGSSGTAQFLSRNVAFMNAYAQQIDVLAQTLAGGGLKGRSRKEALKNMGILGGTLALTSLMYVIAVAADPDYQELDDETKIRNIFIPKSLTKFVGMDRAMILPMNTSASFFFKSMPELLYNKVMNEGTKYEVDKTRLMKSVKNAMVDSLLGPNPIPSGVKPFVEIGLNRNFFTGGNVTPKGMEKLDAAEQYNANTSELGKTLSGLMYGAINPMEADHLMRSLGGSVSALAMWGSNLLASDRPEDEMKQMPIIGQFVLKDVPRGAEDLFYDFKERSDKEYNTWNKMMERDKFDEADKYFDKHEGLIAAHDFVTAMDADLKEINKQIRSIGETTDKTYKPGEKRTDITDLQRLKLEMLEDIRRERKEAGL
jgi:GNAT superfamily N-acetyltransferase/Ca2+-binding EF-hand superfamily protein